MATKTCKKHEADLITQYNEWTNLPFTWRITHSGTNGSFFGFTTKNGGSNKNLWFK